ncbi:X-ray repair cross-complementing protein 5-like isoform X1 [Hylaeus anthracinus]|uniref:X-ray repair cross-complementing protein 5-like isoform X1 n=1 Tax=Hylaeus anthracinus TaxID=313031 RepID=UPI0023B96DF3|nr:X-ray repair cross-complementing protein 5-like isoform X1 [Hylaeus anthracinus]
MPPKSEKEAIVLLINIGVTCPNTENNSSLLEKIKHISKRIIEKKIFLRPKDEIAVLLMGSPITKNCLNTEHVRELTDFQIPNWDLIQEIMNVCGTNYCSNWIEALYATTEFIKKNVIDNSTKKVILMSDFNEEDDIISQFETDSIADLLHTEKIEFLSIGEEALDDRPENTLKISEIFLKDIHKKMNSQHITFSNAISDLRFYLEIPPKPAPWNAILELVDIKIPIVSYIKVTDTKKFPAWKIAKGDKKVISVSEYSDRQRTVYNKEEMVSGYKYGGDFIPVEKTLEEAMSYKSGPQSYKIYSFTKRSNIGLEHWYDYTTRIVLPRLENAEDPFFSLVLAMHKMDVVAIVRKVYRNDCAPKMVTLFPCIDIPDEPWCLVEISLAFAEDRRVMDTRPIKSVMKQLSNEQNEAIDNLLDSLMLPETEDSYALEGSQYFLPGSVSDPAVQHRWHMLSHRALNPDKPLLPMEDYLCKIFEVPSVKEQSRSHLQRIAQLFQLESINHKAEQKEESKKEDNVQDGNRIEEFIKTDDKNDNADSLKEPVMFMDTSDIDLDELVKQIKEKYAYAFVQSVYIT